MKRTFNITLILVLFIGLFFSCTSENASPASGETNETSSPDTSSVTSENKAPESTADFKVEYAGALRNIMHKGDLSAQIDLTQFEGKKNIYALGALENLKGEILISNDMAYISSEERNMLKTVNDYNYNATLLVYATVENWKPYEIPDSITNSEQMGQFIEATAIENGIAPDKAFPFKLEGEPDYFKWHVINWADGDTVHTHEKHVQSGLNGHIDQREVQMVGFYSTAHHTIFTHHSTNMHVHVVTKDQQLAGHVDEFAPKPGMILYLPDGKN